MRKTLKYAAAALAFSASAFAVPTAFAGTLEPQTQRFIDSLAGATPIYTLPPTEARDVLAGAQKSVPVELADATATDLVLPLGPTGSTSIRVYRPMGVKGELPVVIYTHGGGWVLGDKQTHERLVRELTAGSGAMFVFVDYERSPEARYPIAIEQVYAVLEYVANNPDEFGADPSRIAIAGDSVGGDMTAAVALLDKERGGPKLTAQLLFYPVTDASMSTASYGEFADGPWLTKEAMAWFWNQYLPDTTKRGDIHVSPINASTQQLKGLPQTLLIVDENDVLRDEGEAFGRNLAAAGVDVTSVRYNGTIHDFMLLNPIAETAAVRGAVSQAVTYLRGVFAK
ncbi:alpha/beta hydrolase [Qipengyuania sp. GH25]|uniref:Alpha/beta hydrolase n=1 Tax=Qipengyuania pacifica TaxID=2860199 RepID=A0ABS7JK86_9SPHN|nr:alpha/beta hydrolase [Qipengyuania aerophila]MBX7489801.1 alpha/beta hydrolase [Qipengyuania aerophila]